MGECSGSRQHSRRGLAARGSREKKYKAAGVSKTVDKYRSRGLASGLSAATLHAVLHIAPLNPATSCAFCDFPRFLPVRVGLGDGFAVVEHRRSLHVASRIARCSPPPFLEAARWRRCRQPYPPCPSRPAARCMAAGRATRALSKSAVAPPTAILSDPRPCQRQRRRYCLCARSRRRRSRWRYPNGRSERWYRRASSNQKPAPERRRCQVVARAKQTPPRCSCPALHVDDGWVQGECLVADRRHHLPPLLPPTGRRQLFSQSGTPLQSVEGKKRGVQLRTRPRYGVPADRGAWAYNAGTPRRIRSAALDANSAPVREVSQRQQLPCRLGDNDADEQRKMDAPHQPNAPVDRTRHDTNHEENHLVVFERHGGNQRAGQRAPYLPRWVVPRPPWALRLPAGSQATAVKKNGLVGGKPEWVGVSACVASETWRNRYLDCSQPMATRGHPRRAPLPSRVLTGCGGHASRWSLVANLRETVAAPSRPNV